MEPAPAIGTAVLKSRPTTSSGSGATTETSSAISSTPDLSTTSEKQKQQPPALPSLLISPATPSCPQQRTPPPSVGPRVPNPSQTEDGAPETPFSIFTPLQKRLISLASALAALFSTLSSFIYYPAQTRIASDLGVSLMQVQLTITSYLVVAGVAPAFMGDMADRGGRRPVYVLMFALMLGANVGIAVNYKYVGLVVLRMVQSAGSSGMYGAAYGVIADIATIDERGSFVGVLLLMTDFATSLGPVIGGALTQGLGWRWIFWFLVIFAGSHFVAMLLLFPETQRNIVGNGSIRPKGLIYQTVFSLVRKGKAATKDTEAIAVGEEKKQDGQSPTKSKFRFPNPLACLPVLKNKGSLLVILITAINYAVKAALQTSLDAQCVDLYGLTNLQAGLIYLPSGVGGGFGSYGAGKFIDWNYRRVVENSSKNQLEPVDKNSPDFPLEQTRLRGIYLLHAITILGILGYGFTLKYHWHIAVMLIMQLLTGTATAATFTLCGTLLTDLNMNKSATAQAASNLVRCLSAGGAVAILQPMVERMGPAGCFAVYAAIILIGMHLAWFLERYGVAWRKGQAAAS